MGEQRRLVTVVFADVVGSTALAEELDAEDVRALLTRYYGLANDVVTSHGGIVAKLLGDGVLACFGIPIAHGDDAQRALDAALALREAVGTDSALERLQLRIGVNTGEVLANEDASGEIVGDAVNVAARVASAAGEGEILAADSTHRSAPGAVFGAPREIAAKGKSQPVRVWPVTAAVGERTVSATPFAGRDDELAQLELVARRAFRDRRPHLVTITGPTGIGKTRLIEEFRGRLTTDAWHAHAHCPPYGQMLAFGPLRDLLLELLGLPVGATPEDVRQRLQAVLGDTGSRDAMLIGATVAPEGGLDEQDRESVFAAWRRLVVRLASERPLLVILEDLHNAAASVLDLVEQFSQPGVEAPLLVVCLARPQLLQGRGSWGGGHRNSMNLSLEPLDDREIAMLVARLLETEPPPALRDRIVERAAGNPFFAEELVRSLMDRGPLDLRDPAAVERSLGGLPETVQATVLARIDLLPADERAVLQAAAVVGRSFDRSTLAVICDLDPPRIDQAAAALVERELIARSADGSLSFRSALVRDVAYGMLPRARRARDHALVARALEASAGERADELASLIALHYVEATKLRRASAIPIAIEGVDADATRRSAIAWVGRAARTVAIAGAWGDAMTQLQEGLAVAATDGERMGLLTLLGEVSSGGEIGWDAIDGALRLWRAQGDREPAMGARIIVAMLQMLFRSGVSIPPERHPDAATQERLAAEGLDLARQSGDELLLAAALVTHAYLERSRADRAPQTLVAARAEAEQAAAILERRESWMMWSVAHDVWAAIEGDLGDLRRGHEIAARRIQRIDRLPALERAHARWTMPLYTLALGEMAAARRFLDEAYDEPALWGSRWAFVAAVGKVFILSLRAATHWALGGWDEVVADARDALDTAITLPDDATRSVFAHSGVAALYVAWRRGDDELRAVVEPIVRRWVHDERARALLDDDPAHLDAALDRVTSAGIDTWQVERSLSLLNAHGRVPVGADALDPLVASAAARGLVPLEAQLLRLRARALGSLADVRRAHTLLAACGMRGDAALAAVEMAALGDGTMLAEARATLERLGDRRGLAAAEAAGRSLES